MIKSPVTSYEIMRAEFAIILAENELKIQQDIEEFHSQTWAEMLRRRYDNS